MKAVLNGYSQILLQENSFTGLFFLIGIIYNSPIMALGSLFGVSISTTTAFIMQYDRDAIQSGLYGFNGALLGIGFSYFFAIDLALLLIFAAAAVSSPLFFYIQRNITPYTAPFVMITWVILIVVNIIGWQNPTMLPAHEEQFSLIQAFSNSFSQVMLQDNSVTGWLFIIGILCNSLRALLFASTGSLITIGAALLVDLPTTLINSGLYSFNAVLSAIALSYPESSLVKAAIAALLASSLTVLFFFFNLLPLTAPFVITTWLMLYFRYRATH